MGPRALKRDGNRDWSADRESAGLRPPAEQWASMIRSLGALGILGLLVAIAGIGVIAYVNPIVAGGIVAILVGIGLVVVNLVRGMMAKLGFGGMF